MSGKVPAATPKRSKTRRTGPKPGERLAAVVQDLQAALVAVKDAGPEPMDLCEQLRGALTVIDDTATTVREMRLDGVLAAYPDRSVPASRTGGTGGGIPGATTAGGPAYALITW
ncbi:hypothetical protein ACFRAR_04225 [Kitasatospora sp. NPDC056651]|uniref:hypothetical protein n=1 Tax=Kitasatospora sp. NPDC056651 TaxID=3345892 RepID=UPI0036C2DA21